MKLDFMKILIVSILLILSCSNNYKTNFINQKMRIQLDLNPEPSLKENGYFYYGHIVVTNITNSEIKYSNQYLMILSDDNSETRTNVDSPASITVDFSEVEIKAKQSLELDVYWVFENKIDIKKIALIYKKSID